MLVRAKIIKNTLQTTQAFHYFGAPIMNAGKNIIYNTSASATLGVISCVFNTIIGITTSIITG